MFCQNQSVMSRSEPGNPKCITGSSVIVGVLLAVGVVDAVSVIDGVGVIVGVLVGGAGSQALLSAINAQNKSAVRCFNASMAGVLRVAGS